MKKFWIYLLSIIILILAYGQYKQYKRFSLENYEYKADEGIDLAYYDKAFLLNYYEAIENLNGCIITEWSTNGIDVRNPEDSDEETKAAVKRYTKKLANVKFYEDRLIESAKLKAKGLSKEEVQSMLEDGISLKDQRREAYASKIIEMFKAAPTSVKLGESNALVFEIQKLLKAKGYNVPVDGVFKTLTADAIKDFEAKNKLYSDGQLNVFTLEKLLER